MRSAVAGFWADETAVTSMEYALIAALIAVVLIGSVASIGDWSVNVWQQISACLGAGC